MKKILILLFSFFWVATAYAATGEITFENDQLPAGQELTASESYWNGSTGPGGLTSFSCGGAQFNNFYDAAWFSWGGVGYSNRTDTTLDGFTAQYNAIPGSGALGSTNYGVAYVDSFNNVTPTITFPAAQNVRGFYVANSNYTYYSMLNGDAFAKKFELCG